MSYHPLLSLFYFLNCPRFALTFLDGSAHIDQCLAKKSILPPHCPGPQEMPVWVSGIWEKIKMYSWEEKMSGRIKGTGYWIQTSAAPKKNKRPTRRKKLRVLNTLGIILWLEIWPSGNWQGCLGICIFLVNLNIQRPVRSMSSIIMGVCVCVWERERERERRGGREGGRGIKISLVFRLL